MSDSNIVQNIEHIIKQNKKDIMNLVNSGSGGSGQLSQFNREFNGKYKKSGCDKEIGYTILFSLTYRDEQPHKFQIEDGRYRIEIRCKMDDTSILTELQDDMRKFSNKYIPSRQDVVTKHYPEHEVRISHDIEEKEIIYNFI